MNQPANFDKYDAMGAYHWRECDRSSSSFNPPLVARYDAVLRRVPRGRVLDIGAGDGYLTGRLSEKCSEVVGIEYEQAGVELAQRMLQGRANVTLLKGSSYDLPFPPETFDGVVMADVIEHLDNPAIAVAEMARVAKRDATALVTTPHWRADRVWDKRHVKEFTGLELKDLLRTGFSDVQLRYCWPRVWSDFYRTRIGWRLLRLAGRVGLNPFLDESDSSATHCQIIAICKSPIRARQ
jgi:SAM-dependent methyltransferase